MNITVDRELLEKALKVIQKSRSGYGDDYPTPEEYDVMDKLETALADSVLITRLAVPQSNSLNIPCPECGKQLSCGEGGGVKCGSCGYLECY